MSKHHKKSKKEEDQQTDEPNSLMQSELGNSIIIETDNRDSSFLNDTSRVSYTVLLGNDEESKELVAASQVLCDLNHRYEYAKSESIQPLTDEIERLEKQLVQ